MAWPTDQVLKRSRTAAALTRTRRLAIGTGVFFGLGAPMLAVAAFHGPKIDWLFVLMTLVAMGVAFLTLRSAWRNRAVLSSPLLALVRAHPERIVWLHVEKATVEGIPLDSQTVFVGCDPREVFVFASVDAEAVLAELSGWCPQAHVGWSPAAQRQFDTDPGSLRADRVGAC